MATPKINATAKVPFSHGNVDAIPGRTYAMNAADAKELEKAGFVTLEVQEVPEKAQTDHVPQEKQVGDVVVDDADDLLGDTKADKDLDNKMAPAPANKRTTHKK